MSPEEYKEFEIHLRYLFCYYQQRGCLNYGSDEKKIPDDIMELLRNYLPSYGSDPTK